MFDIGFGELLLIAVVALVVLGPERLPKAARFAGLWVRRARHQWDSVRQELERELHADELQRNLRQVRQSIQQADDGLREHAGQLQQGAEAFRREVEQAAPEVFIEPRPVEPRAAATGDADAEADSRAIALDGPLPAPADGVAGAGERTP